MGVPSSSVSRVIAAIVVAGALALPSAALGQADYPSRSITVITPYPPGGAGDVSIELGRPVIVDNKPGGSTALGLSIAAKAAPDGYTIGYAPQTMVVNPHLYRALPYDTFGDFVPVAKTALLKYVLVVNPETPAASVRQLLDYARQNPEKLTFGSSGVGNGSHLAGELLMRMTGVKFLHVPYKGEGPAMVDVLGGRLSMMFATVATAEPHIKAGKVKALGVAAEDRSARLPDVPTIGETVPGYSSTFWIGLVAPKGTPPDRVAVLSKAVNAVLVNPELTQALQGIGIDHAAPNKPEEFGAFMRKEWDLWGDLIRANNIRGE